MSSPANPGPQPPAGQIIPPVDLKTPVTNPNLLAAIEGFAHSKSKVRIEALTRELNRAVFLLPALLDEAEVQPTDTFGQAVITQGSKLKIPAAGDTEPYLPLFTDWEQLRAWIDVPVTGMVLPAQDAWSFAMQNYAGAVINPAGQSIPLRRELIHDLIQRGRART